MQSSTRDIGQKSKLFNFIYLFRFPLVIILLNFLSQILPDSYDSSKIENLLVIGQAILSAVFGGILANMKNRPVGIWVAFCLITSFFVIGLAQDIGIHITIF